MATVKPGSTVSGQDENAWRIITSFSLSQYCIDSVKFYASNVEMFKNEILSGITVAVMQVPESVAFSFVAGVPPLVGLRVGGVRPNTP